MIHAYFIRVTTIKFSISCTNGIKRSILAVDGIGWNSQRQIQNRRVNGVFLRAVYLNGLRSTRHDDGVVERSVSSAREIHRLDFVVKREENIIDKAQRHALCSCRKLDPEVAAGICVACYRAVKVNTTVSETHEAIMFGAGFDP